MRLGSKHEALLSALLCGLDKSSRINRFGHPASDARVQGYAKEAMARAAYVAGAFDAGQLIGVVEVFEPGRDGVAEAAFAVAADWRRQGVGSGLLAAARRWAEQSGIRTLRMFISRNNWPMRQFAHNAGARLNLDLQILADIAVATAASLDIVATRGTPDSYQPRVGARFFDRGAQAKPGPYHLLSNVLVRDRIAEIGE
jgi:GNAT superfamily N-acetyltransferase